MKRLIMLLMFILILVGCATSDIEKTTESFIGDSKELKIATNEHINEALKIELTDKKNELLGGIASSLGLSDIDTIKDIDGYELLSTNLLELQSNLSHEIIDVYVSNSKSKAEISIDIEYVDIGKLVIDNLNEVLDRNVLKMYNGEDVVSEDIFSDTIELINKSIESVDINEMKITKNAKLSAYKTESNWVINEIDARALNALTLGFTRHMNDELNEKFEDVKTNRVFLEIENNLRSIFKHVQDYINENDKVNYKNFIDKHGSKLSEQLTEEFDLEVIVVNEIRDKEGVYNVTKGEENELSIVITVDGEVYTFSKEI